MADKIIFNDSFSGVTSFHIYDGYVKIHAKDVFREVSTKVKFSSTDTISVSFYETVEGICVLSLKITEGANNG